MKYIEKTFTDNTGGGTYVDFIILKDGRCIGLNDECVALYDSYEQFYDGPYEDVQIIDLLEEKTK